LGEEKDEAVRREGVRTVGEAEKIL